MKYTTRITLLTLAISALLAGRNVLAETVNEVTIDTLKPAREEAHLAATKIFYATLSTVQRLTFDKGFDFKPHGRFGNHGKK